MKYRVWNEDDEESHLRAGDQIIVDLRREVYYFARGGKPLRRVDGSFDRSIRQAEFRVIRDTVERVAGLIDLEARLAVVNDEEVVNDFAGGLKVGRAEQPPIYTFVLVEP